MRAFKLFGVCGAKDQIKIKGAVEDRLGGGFDVSYKFNKN